MYNVKNLEQEKGIAKIKQIVNDVKFCFFCTNPENQNSAEATVMTAQTVDEHGKIWFFSGRDSDRNRNIKTNQNVQLYFSCPEKDAYLAVNATASIVFDREKMEELWNPILNIWFKDGVDDQNISLIQATAVNANYWDSKDGKMINFFKMIASAITGNDVTDSTHGSINVL